MSFDIEFRRALFQARDKLDFKISMILRDLDIDNLSKSKRSGLRQQVRKLRMKYNEVQNLIEKDAETNG